MVTNCHTYPGADCGSDHNPVVATLRLKLKKVQKSFAKTKLQYRKLIQDNKLKKEFQMIVNDKLRDRIPSDQMWNTFKQTLQHAAKEIIPTSKSSRPEKGWMTEEILRVMEKRRLVKGKSEDLYRQYDRQIKNLCNKAKERWLEDECEKIEKLFNIDTSAMYENIRKLSGKRSMQRSACIKAEEGRILTDSINISDRWRQYIEELFRDDRGEPPTIRSLEGPLIGKDEIRKAMKELKRGKAVGPDEISIEMILALHEQGVDVLQSIFNEVYNSGNLPEDFLKSIFVALPKKPSATDCKDHRTISIMSHVLKILLKIITNRTRTAQRDR